jgi:hypothetical protein
VGEEMEMFAKTLEMEWIETVVIVQDVHENHSMEKKMDSNSII